MASNREKIAKHDFDFVEKAYRSAYKKKENLIAGKEKYRAEGIKLYDEIEKLKEKRDNLKSNDAKFKTTVEIEVKQEELNELYAKLLTFTDLIEDSKVDDDFVKNHFKERIPEGEALLEEMKNADREKRYNIKSNQLDIQSNKLRNEVRDTESVEKLLVVNDEFKKAFEEMSKYPWNCLDLSKKEKIAKLSPSEELELKKFREDFAKNKKEVKRILKEEGINSFDFTAYENNLFDKPNMTLEENLSDLKLKSITRINEINEEKEVMDEFYLETEALKGTTEGKEDSDEGRDDDDEEELSLIKRTGNKFKEFFEKVKKFFNRNEEKDDDERDDDKEAQEGKNTKDPNEELSDSFMNRMKSSELFKEELRKQAEADEKEIEQRLEDARAAKMAEELKKTTEKDHER